jgi:hypothetical protein
LSFRSTFVCHSAASFVCHSAASFVCHSAASFVCHSAAPLFVIPQHLLFVIPQHLCLSFRSGAKESAFLHSAMGYPITETSLSPDFEEVILSRQEMFEKECLKIGLECPRLDYEVFHETELARKCSDVCDDNNM